MSKINTVIIGSLNTDLIINGAKKLLGNGESTLAEEFVIAPGGKSRNLAAMIVALNGKGENMAFLGKTLKDELKLWEYPYNSLKDLGVDMSYVKVIENHPKYKFPGLAIIPIDVDGRNQVYLVPNIREEFHKEDICDAAELFKVAAQNNGIVGLTLEMPIDAAVESMKIIKENNLKSFIDAGGIEGRPQLIDAINVGGFLIKPNEHEARAITGIEITDFESAKISAQKIMEIGYEYVVITHGDKGAYAFGKDLETHIRTNPNIDISTGNSVGCGDQTMAGIIYAMSAGKSVEEAINIGVLAGSLQHTKSGVIPVTLDEINKYL